MLPRRIAGIEPYKNTVYLLKVSSQVSAVMSQCQAISRIGRVTGFCFACVVSVASAQDPGLRSMDLMDAVQTARGLESAVIKGEEEPPIDDDGDGVSNDVDQCPDTPAGEAVDVAGCSESQLEPEDPEAAVRQVYEDDVNPLIVSAQGGCTSSGCHGRTGAPGGLQLYGAGTANSTQLNYDSFVSYIDRNGASRLLSKISGVGHGGGTRYASDTSEYATIEAWTQSVEALP